MRQDGAFRPVCRLVQAPPVGERNVVLVMTINQCSKCRRDGHVLEGLTRVSWVDYYRCVCGNVWTVARNARQDRLDVTYRSDLATHHRVARP